MQISITTNDFTLTPALERFIREQTSKSLRACKDQIVRVSIRLKDLNGPKGGQDKECCVEVKVPNTPAVVVSKRSSDAYACLRKTIGRAARVTLRRLNKKRSVAYSNRSFSNSGLDIQERDLEMETTDEQIITLFK